MELTRSSEAYPSNVGAACCWHLAFYPQKLLARPQQGCDPGHTGLGNQASRGGVQRRREGADTGGGEEVGPEGCGGRLGAGLLQRLQLGGPCPRSEGPGLVLAAYPPLQQPPPWAGAPSTPAHVSRCSFFSTM